MSEHAARLPTPTLGSPLRGIGTGSLSPHSLFLIVSAALSFLGLLLHLASLASALPPAVGTWLAGCLFLWAPGLALFSFASLFQAHTYHYLTLFLISSSLGLTFNFLANIAIYLLQPSLMEAIDAYLWCLALLYVVLLATWWRRNLWEAYSREVSSPLTLLLPLALAVAATILLQWKEPPPFLGEEFIILRKLVENTYIAHSNVNIAAGEHTTYIFVPFFQLVAMVGEFTSLGPLQAVIELWAPVVVLSTAVLAKITHLLTGRWMSAWLVVCLLAGAVVLTEIPPTPFVSTIFAFPDRYSFPTAVLLPLALFHFLMHLRDERINVSMFLGLIYLLTEITFVHARETVYILGLILVYTAVHAAHGEADRRFLIKTVWVVLCVLAIVAFYTTINLALSAELNTFIDRGRDYMLAQLADIRANFGPFTLFAPRRFQYDYEYREFLNSLRGFDGLPIYALALTLLPLYAWLAPSAKSLFLCASIALLMIFSLSPPIKIVVALLSGAPVISDVFGAIAVLVAPLVADMLRMAANAVINPAWHLQARVTLAIGIAGVSALFLYLFVWATDDLLTLRGLHVAVALSAITIILLRLRHRRLGAAGVRWVINRPEVRPRQSGMHWGLTFATALVILLVAMPPAGSPYFPVPQDKLWSLPRGYRPEPLVQRADTSFAERYHRLQTSGDYRRYVRGAFMATGGDLDLPTNVIDYIRDRIPPQQIWFGGETFRVLLVSNQFAAVVTDRGRYLAGFVKNCQFLETWRPQTNPYSGDQFDCRDRIPVDTASWLKPEGIALLEKIGEGHDSVFIIAGPAEYEAAKAAAARQGSLTLLFDADSHLILRLDRKP